MKSNRLSVVRAVLVVSNILVLVQCADSQKDLKKKGDFEDENYGVKYASKCEVCKVVTGEVEYQLNSNFKSPEVIETGYNFMTRDKDKAKKVTKYETSMIRLQEALESTCKAILEYNIHKERKDWTRFARGQSQTFKTLHGLKNKGVKVDLGMPEQMWDKPSAEITQLKSQCETFLENNEEDIEEWFQNGSKIPLEDHICKKTLKKKERGCLAIKALPEPTSAKKSKDEKKSKPKKDKKTTEDKPKSELKVESKEKSEEDPIIGEPSTSPAKEEAKPATETLPVTDEAKGVTESPSVEQVQPITESSVTPTPPITEEVPTFNEEATADKPKEEKPANEKVEL